MSVRYRDYCKQHIRELEKGEITELEIPAEYLYGRALAKDLVDKKSGEVIVECNTLLSEESLALMTEANVKQIETLYTNELDRGPFVADTLRQDTTRNALEALAGSRLKTGDGDALPAQKAPLAELAGAGVSEENAIRDLVEHAADNGAATR